MNFPHSHPATLRLRIHIWCGCMVAMCTSASALSWDTQVIDSGFPTTSRPAAKAMAVGADGSVHVVYTKTTFNETGYPFTEHLQYAVRTPSTSWALTTLEMKDINEEYGNCSLLLDSANRPYVVNREHTGDIVFRRFNGTAWIGPLSILAGSSPTLAMAATVDAANDLHVVSAGTGGRLDYRLWDRSANTVSGARIVNDGIYVGEQIGIALVPSNSRPRVSYIRNADLLCAVRGSAVTSSWTPETVREYSGATKSLNGSSLAYFGATAYVSYYDPSNQGLYFANESGNPWARQLIGTFDLDNSVNSFRTSTRLFFDSKGRPYVVWRKDGGELNVSYRPSSTWKTTVITQAREADFAAAMKNDRLYVAYNSPDRTKIQLASAGISPLVQFSGWSENVFTPAQLAAYEVSGPQADPDGDGLANLIEFALGLPPLGTVNPTVTPGGTVPGLPLIRSDQVAGEPSLTVEFLRRKASVNSGVVAEVEFSTSLVGASGWTTAFGDVTVTPINDEWERVVARDTALPASAVRFARVKVSEAP